MEINYQKTFYTKISEYQVQVETNNNGKKLITISRFLADKKSIDPSEKINIHPAILNDLIDSLEDCGELLGLRDNGKPKRFTLERKKEIQNRYLKGISVKDLCIQFSTNPLKIEEILWEANIEIIHPKLSKPPKPYWRRRKKREP